MTAFFKPLAFAAAGGPGLAPFDAAGTARLDAARAGEPPPGRDGAERVSGAPVATLAHGANDRWRIRVDGRQAHAFLDLAASELAWSPDVLRIRVNRASASLVLWVREGSELCGGDGSQVVALVSETLRRIALGQRRCAAPVESGEGLGLSHLLGPAKLLIGA
jgi:hypothetical protein